MLTRQDKDLPGRAAAWKGKLIPRTPQARVQAEYPVHVTEEEVREAILSFLGDYMQIPPMYPH